MQSNFFGVYVNLARFYQTEGKRQKEAEIWRSYSGWFGPANKYSAYARERLLDPTERIPASE